MKQNCKTREECEAFAQKLMTSLKADPVVSAVLEDPDKLQTIIDHFDGLKDTVTIGNGENTPVNEESPEYRLYNRLKSLKDLVERAQEPGAYNQLLGGFINAVGIAEDFDDLLTGGGTDGDSLQELTAKLLGKYGQDKLDDPNYAFLFHLSGAVSDTENLFAMTADQQALDELSADIHTLQQDRERYQQMRNSLIEDLYKIDPEATIDSLETTKKNLQVSANKAEGELKSFHTEEYQNSIKISYEAAKKEYDDYLDEERQAQEENRVLTEQAERFLHGGDSEFCLEKLENGGKEDFEDIEENIKKSKDRIRSLETAIDRHDTIDRDLKEANKVREQAEKSLTSLMKAANVQEAFAGYREQQQRVANAGRALELLDKLQAAETSAKLMPALVVMGVLSFDSKAKPKAQRMQDLSESQQKNYPEWAELAGDYRELKECISVCLGKDGPKTVQSFFEELNADPGGRLKPMAKIRERFEETFRDAQVKGTMELNQYGTKVMGSLGGQEMETLSSGFKSLLDAENSIRKLEIEKSLLNDKTSMKEDLINARKNLEETETKRQNMTDRYLEAFGKEPTGKAMSYGELLNVGKSEYSKLKMQAETWDSVEMQMQRNREKGRRKAVMERYSPETQQAKLRELQKDAEKKTKAVTAVKRVLEKYENLNTLHQDMAARDKSIRDRADNVAKPLEDPRLPEALGSIRQHISDATRSFRHNDSQYFKNMKNSLNNVERVMREGTDQQKKEKLESIRDAARIYLQEKKKQNPFRLLPSTMRKTRLAYAEQILKLAQNALERTPEQRSADTISAVRDYCKNERIRHDDGAFRTAFKKEHNNYVIRSEKQKYARNNPVEVGKQAANTQELGTERR